MSIDSVSLTDREIQLLFAEELRRLAAVICRGVKSGDDMVVLSSLAAILPITKTLTEGALSAVTAVQEESCAVQPSGDGDNLNWGYL